MLKKELTEIKSLVNGSTTTGLNNVNTQAVELSSEKAIVINQNDPNPFAEETNITYTLPETATNAKIIFYDNNGKIIKSVDIEGKGNGSLHVYGSNLSAGVYTYSLIVDGKTIDTKKMMKSK